MLWSRPRTLAVLLFYVWFVCADGSVYFGSERNEFGPFYRSRVPLPRVYDPPRNPFSNPFLGSGSSSTYRPFYRSRIPFQDRTFGSPSVPFVSARNSFSNPFLGSRSSSRRFDCGNGNTIPTSQLCDFDDDCKNGADEKSCFLGLFECGNEHAVPRSYVCDGDNDCSNGADERNCTAGNPVASTPEPRGDAVSTTQETPASRLVMGLFFECGNNRYVRIHSMCDGTDDCGNLADERSCNGERQTERFDCGRMGNTVPQSYVCDGDDDCGNGADERNCSHVPRTTESPEQFDCQNGKTIVPRYVCDGDNDCGNGLDEANCDAGSTDAPSDAPDASSEISSSRIILTENASIQSPLFPSDYPHNLNALWNVSTSPGHRIKLDFVVKELEDSRFCTADRLSLYDGQELGSPSLGAYCRHDEGRLPEPVVSSSNAMVVRFTSDSSISWKGFNLTLSPICGGSLLAQTSERSFVSHTKFDEEVYGENINCDWTIKSRPERTVQLRFTKFHVGEIIQSSDDPQTLEEIEVNGCEDSTSGDCVQYNAPIVNAGSDFVEIYDGPDDSSRRIGQYSGDQIPETITSRGEELFIRFRSGNGGGFSGFLAEYKEV